MRHLLVFALFAAGLFAQEPAQADKPMTSAQVRAAAAKSGFVGDAGCRNCHKHDTIWDNYSKNPHAAIGTHTSNAVKGNNITPSETLVTKPIADKGSCESCHGPGAAHVEAGGEIETVVNAFSVMKPQEVITKCLSCHSKEFNRANIRRSEHTQHDISCTACHSIHKSQTQRNLLVTKERELCYQCHTDVRAQFNLPFKHRVNEGMMSCSDCHNPHGGSTTAAGMGQTAKMMNKSHSNEQPCMKCHVDKRGPFVFSHQVGEVDGCGSCHKPHGSTTAKLLTRPTATALCLECHTGTGPFGTRSNRGIVVPERGTHSMVDPRYQRCTGCHVAIHGSNVHYRFLR